MKWNGKNYRPLVPQKIKFQEEKFDVEEYLKSLTEKHDRIPVWRSVIGVNVPVEEGPQPTPSITPSNTPSTTPTGTPTNTPTQTQTNTPTQTATGTPTPTPSAIPSGTTEANAYLSAVVNAGGTVDSSMSAATTTLFTSLISNGLYNKIYRMYPYLGGTASAHAIEGKFATAQINWNGGVTHSASGVTGNGTNGYGNTQVNAFTVPGNGNPSSFGVYVNLQGSTGNRVYDGGVNDNAGLLSQQFNITARRVTGPTDLALFDAGDYGSGNGRVSTTVADANGFTVGTARSASDKELYKNGSSIATQTGAGNLNYANRSIYLFAQNEAGTANWFNSNRHSFAFIGSGLTDSEVSTLSTIVNDYQTSLGRNVY